MITEAALRPNTLASTSISSSPDATYFLPKLFHTGPTDRKVQAHAYNNRIIEH